MIRIRRLVYWGARSTLAWVLALLALVAFAADNGDFFTTGNLFALLQNYAVLAIVSAGLALTMVGGEFDLSISGVFPLAGLIAVKLSDSMGPTAGILLAALVGACFGVANGWLTAVLRIPSLAVTVGAMVLAVGVGYAITGGKIVQATDFSAGLMLTNPHLGIFSIESVVELVLAVGAAVIARRTWTGRYLYAAGSDANRARASGLPVTATIIVAFTLSGLFAGVGGSLQGIALATGQAGSADAFFLQAATAVILGGVALSGGRGSLVGVLGAALLLAVISNGLSLNGASSAAVQLVNGLLLLAIVLVDRPLHALSSARRASASAPVLAEELPA